MIRCEFSDGYNPGERDVEDIQIIGEELVKQLARMDGDDCLMEIEYNKFTYKLSIVKESNTTL